MNDSLTKKHVSNVSNVSSNCSLKSCKNEQKNTQAGFHPTVNDQRIERFKCTGTTEVRGRGCYTGQLNIHPNALSIFVFYFLHRI